MSKTILWWGRTGAYGPKYPRNRTVIDQLQRCGYRVITFRPQMSRFGDVEAAFRRLSSCDLVWVPCFRQRDAAAAIRYAKRRGLPIIFDPLISAYDKQVNEKSKFPADSWRARRLHRWEAKLFNLVDLLLADTEGHRQYFHSCHGVPLEKIMVVPVSAEESVFYPVQEKLLSRPDGYIPEFLFFGSFISLQGAPIIVEAICHYAGPLIRLSLLGDGPERQRCEQICRQNNNPLVTVSFEDWLPFEQLPDRIRAADVGLGIFGSGDKSARVIPNKVYQSLACGLPVITLQSDAYPVQLGESDGVFFVPAGSPSALAEAMAAVAARVNNNEDFAASARAGYQKYFSSAQIGALLSPRVKSL